MKKKKSDCSGAEIIDKNLQVLAFENILQSYSAMLDSAEIEKAKAILQYLKNKNKNGAKYESLLFIRTRRRINVDGCFLVCFLQLVQVCRQNAFKLEKSKVLPEPHFYVY